MVELSEEQVAELRKHTRENPEGVTSDELFKKCRTFGERIDFSRGIHMAKQQGIIYQSGQLYFYVDTNQAATEKAPVKEMKPAVVTKPIPVTPPPVKKEDPPVRTFVKQNEVLSSQRKTKMGMLDFNSKEAQVAFIYWLFRDEVDLRLITIGEITEIHVKWSRPTVNTIITYLLDKGYLTRLKISGSNGYTYKWSEKFDYPISLCSDGDLSILKYRSVEDYRAGRKYGEGSTKTCAGESKEGTASSLVSNKSVSEFASAGTGLDNSSAGASTASLGVVHSPEVARRESEDGIRGLQQSEHSTQVLISEKARIDDTLKMIENDISMYQACIVRLERLRDTLTGKNQNGLQSGTA